MHVGHADDEYFKCVLIKENMFDWLISHYSSWNSRFVIELFLALVASKPILWRLSDKFNKSLPLEELIRC